MIVSPEDVTAAVDALFAEIDDKVTNGTVPQHGYKMGIRLFSAVRDRLQETAAEAMEDMPASAPLIYNGVQLRYSTAWVTELGWIER